MQHKLWAQASPSFPKLQFTGGYPSHQIYRRVSQPSNSQAVSQPPSQAQQTSQTPHLLRVGDALLSRCRCSACCSDRCSHRCCCCWSAGGSPGGGGGGSGGTAPSSAPKDSPPLTSPSSFPSTGVASRSPGSRCISPLLAPGGPGGGGGALPLSVREAGLGASPAAACAAAAGGMAGEGGRAGGPRSCCARSRSRCCCRSRRRCCLAASSALDRVGPMSHRLKRRRKRMMAAGLVSLQQGRLSGVQHGPGVAQRHAAAQSQSPRETAHAVFPAEAAHSWAAETQDRAPLATEPNFCSSLKPAPPADPGTQPLT